MNYSGIAECDVLNGTGFRVVLFVSGCDHKCRGCHNPETWNKDFGYKFTEDTKEYLFECLRKPYIDGITISGGDPLYTENIGEILGLVRDIRLNFPKKSIWLYTGYSYEELMKDKLRSSVLMYIDTLIDGEFMIDKRDITLKFRGSSNQRIIDVHTGKVIE